MGLAGGLSHVSRDIAGDSGPWVPQFALPGVLTGRSHWHHFVGMEAGSLWGVDPDAQPRREPGGRTGARAPAHTVLPVCILPSVHVRAIFQDLPCQEGRPGLLRLTAPCGADQRLGPLLPQRLPPGSSSPGMSGMGRGCSGVGFMGTLGRQVCCLIQNEM